ncbi:MAG: hypothetical protein ACFFFG_11855 [Candidatus Thorarchaeota archaeon]
MESLIVRNLFTGGIVLTDLPSLATLLDSVLGRSEEHFIEPFVADFLSIWVIIHEEAKKATLDDLYPISRRIFHSHVLAFYQKYSPDPSLERVEPWEKRYASITIKWEGHGSYLFPMRFLAYEICYHKDNLLNFYLQGLRSGGIKGTRRALWETLLPVLGNFIVPLDPLDVALLKTRTLLQTRAKNPFREFSKADYLPHVEASKKTVMRRLRRLDEVGVLQDMLALDMGQLGYETTLLFHTDGFPAEYRDYLLLSSTMQLGTFSLLQIPYSQPKILASIRSLTDTKLNFSMDRRLVNWNLTGLMGGEDPWQIPPSLLYGEPEVDLIAPTPNVDFSLSPVFSPFPLKPADIKVLDFYSIKGSFQSVSALSKAIGVSVTRISTGLKEMVESHLVVRVGNPAKVGLDLTIFFYLSIEGGSISWMDHFLTFPKADVFSHNEGASQVYFGHLKLPNKWIKPFARNMDRILEAQRDADMRFYWKIYTPVDRANWGIPLSTTYPQEGSS